LNIPFRDITLAHIRVMRNPGLAAVCSFFITGLGQIYNGQIFKGLLFMAVWGVAVLMSFLLIGLPILVIVWVWGIIDAYRTAERLNRMAGSSHPPAHAR